MGEGEIPQKVKRAAIGQEGEEAARDSHPGLWGLQAEELYYDAKQAQAAGQIPAEQVLQVLQEAHLTQRGEVRRQGVRYQCAKASSSNG